MCTKDFNMSTMKYIFTVITLTLAVSHFSALAQQECPLQNDFASDFVDQVDNWLNSGKLVTNRITTVMENSDGIYLLPDSNDPTITNSSTRKLLWGDIFSANFFPLASNGIGEIGLAPADIPSTNFLVTYAFLTTTNLAYMCHRQEDSTGNKNFTCYNCDQQTGQVPANPTIRYPQTQNFNTSGRIWYTGAKKNPGNLVWGVINSKGIASVGVFASKQVTRGGKNYITFTNLRATHLDSILGARCPSPKVCYAMETSSLKLIATSVGLKLNYTQIATSSSDSWIKSSSSYIVDNKLTVSTDRYLPDLGYSMQVRFYLSEDPGITWTLVSLDSTGIPTTSTAASTATSSGDSDNISLTLDIVSATLAVLVIFFLVFGVACFYILKNSTPALAGSKSSNL